MIKGFLAGTLLLLLATVARSEGSSAKEMIPLLQTRDPRAMNFFNGIRDGLGWANGDLSTDNRPKLFCVPVNEVRHFEDDLYLIKEYLKVKPMFADRPVGAVLMFALKAAFPCH